MAGTTVRVLKSPVQFLETRAVYGPFDREEGAPYRYQLRLVWDRGLPVIVWVMLNPSTATATRLDPTVLACLKFSIAWGFGGLVIVNLFALRATDPKELYRHASPIGIGNDAHILEVALGARRVMLAWGNHGSFMHRSEQVRVSLRLLDVETMALKFNRGKPNWTRGEPVHPLYQPETTRPVHAWPTTPGPTGGVL